MMRFGGRATADDAGGRGDELAMLLVAQANGFRRNTTRLDNGRLRSGCLQSVERLALRQVMLVVRNGNRVRPNSARARPGSARGSSLDRFEPFPEAGF